MTREPCPLCQSTVDVTHDEDGTPTYTPIEPDTRIVGRHHLTLTLVDQDGRAISTLTTNGAAGRIYWPLAGATALVIRPARDPHTDAIFHPAPGDTP